MWCLIDHCHSEHQAHESDGQKWMQAGEGVNYTDGLFYHADSSWADRLSVKQASLTLIPTGGCCTQSLWSVEDSMHCISRRGCPLFTDLKDFGQISRYSQDSLWPVGFRLPEVVANLPFVSLQGVQTKPWGSILRRELSALDIKKLFTPWNVGSGGGSLPAAHLCLQGEKMTQWEISL